MTLEEALHELPAGRNAKRLLPLWPAIEAKLAAGVSCAEILTLLRSNGFEMSLGTFKVYLHRQRKKQRAKPRSTSIKNQAPSAPAPTDGNQPPVGNGPKRPPTFEYDPRGIPDLLT